MDISELLYRTFIGRQIKRYSLLAAALLLLVAGSSPFAAAQNPEERKRELLERIESLRPTEAPPRLYHRFFAYEWGGWLTETYSDSHNDSNSTPDYAFREDLRLWVKAGIKIPEDLSKYLGIEHYVYFRAKNATQHEHRGNSDNDGPHVDMLYVTNDFGRVKTRIGRRFYALGQGITYADINDGADLELRLNPFLTKVFYSKTLPHQHNVDTSFPGFDKHYNRHFFGTETQYLIIPKHLPYFYYMRTIDRSDETPISNSADFDYDSYYLGGGSRGEFFIPNLRYFNEWIWERGKSRLANSIDAGRVKAWAVNAGLEYYFLFPTHPTLKAEFSHGSGDKDRASVTNTTNGNTEGRDKNFLYYGSFPNGGSALTVRLSNIDVYKFGWTLKPFEFMDSHKIRNRLWSGIRESTFGVNYYIFRKSEDKGGISDTRATLGRVNIGNEWDLFFTWRLTSDLNWSFQWANFKPGSAFPSREHERFISTSLTWAF